MKGFMSLQIFPLSASMGGEHERTMTLYCLPFWFLWIWIFIPEKPTNTALFFIKFISFVDIPFAFSSWRFAEQNFTRMHLTRFSSIELFSNCSAAAKKLENIRKINVKWFIIKSIDSDGVNFIFLTRRSTVMLTTSFSFSQINRFVRFT